MHLGSYIVIPGYQFSFSPVLCDVGMFFILYTYTIFFYDYKMYSFQLFLNIYASICLTVFLYKNILTVK